MSDDKKGKRYPVDFKAEAVRLLLTSGRSQEQPAKEPADAGVKFAKIKQ